MRNIVQGRHNSKPRPAVKEQNGIGFESGGAYRIRTGDLYTASVAR